MIVSGDQRQRKRFDDPFMKHEHALQDALKQLVPRTPDGGREILYWCRACRTPWYERGRRERHTQLSQSQLWTVSQRLLTDIRFPSLLPSALCPRCASAFFGGIPRIEVYMQDRGYCLFWDRVKSPSRFLCALSVSSFSLMSDAVHEALTCPSDVPLPEKRVEEMVQWLSTLPDPAFYQIEALTPEHCAHLAACFEAPSRFTWQGYSWSTFCPPLNRWITVILAVTFYRESLCSPHLLLACWRQMAKAIQSAI